MKKVFFLSACVIALISCNQPEPQVPQTLPPGLQPSAPPAQNQNGNTQPQHSDAQNPNIKADKTYSEFGYGGEGMTSPIMFSKVTTDRGVIRKGEASEAEYPYKNVSDHSVVIEKVLTSCNCMTADFKREPIHPGETGIIKTRFDSRDQGIATYEKIVSVIVKDAGTAQALMMRVKVVE